MEKLELIKRNTVEIVTETELKELLIKKKSLIAYCGYEPSGPLHLGHLVTLTKLRDFQRAGFKIKILLADLHAFLNKKGNEEEIEREVSTWKKLLKIMNPDFEIVLGSNFQLEKEYLRELFKIAQKITITRSLKSMQEISRNLKEASISQAIYPIMQVLDIKYLEADVAVGGTEQRKVHMIGKELQNFLGHHFVAVHLPLISSLKNPSEKMSKSIPGSYISVLDSEEKIKRTIHQAYCPEKNSKENPILQIVKLILFPLFGKIEVKREKKFGGTIEFSNYESLEREYEKGNLHPLDLKNSVTEYLIEMTKNIREKYY